jgi:hypothetical protein
MKGQLRSRITDEKTIRKYDSRRLYSYSVMRDSI